MFLNLVNRTIQALKERKNLEIDYSCFSYTWPTGSIRGSSRGKRGPQGDGEGGRVGQCQSKHTCMMCLMSGPNILQGSNGREGAPGCCRARSTTGSMYMATETQI